MFSEDRLIIPAVNPTDINEIGKLAEHLSGNILFINGFTGGLSSMSFQQKKEYLTAWAGAFGSDNLLAGVSSELFHETLELADIADGLGIKHIVDCPLYRPDRPNLIKRVRELSQLGLNLWIYNNPTLGSIGGHEDPNISSEEFKEMSSMIYGFKESNEEFLYSRLEDIQSSEDPPLIYAGSVSQYLKDQKSVDGIVAGDANIMPQLFRGLCSDNPGAIHYIRQNRMIPTEDDYIDTAISIFEYVLICQEMVSDSGIIKPAGTEDLILNDEQKQIIETSYKKFR